MAMKDGFKSLEKPEDALEAFLAGVDPISRFEVVNLEVAHARVAAEDITASRSSPNFRRAAMDGYAVQAADTFGGSASSPVRIQLKDEFSSSGKCATPIHTGSALPADADAVVKFEDAEEGEEYIDVFAPVSPGKNVSPVGEDVQEGEIVVKKGDFLTPSYLGLLRSLNVETVNVVNSPRIAILPTGEELVPPGRVPEPGQAVQSNGIILESCVRNWKAVPKVRSVLSDDPGEIEAGLNWGLDYDGIIFSGGSSVGRRDRLVDVLDERGNLLVHGVAIQPGKPLALSVVESTPVVALPGYPVATLVDAYYFVRPLIFHLLGTSPPELTRSVKIGRKIPSSLGKVSIVRVRVEGGEAFPLRVSGSGVLSSVTRSDGFVRVPADSEGFAAGKVTQLHYWR